MNRKPETLITQKQWLYMKLYFQCETIVLYRKIDFSFLFQNSLSKVNQPEAMSLVFIIILTTLANSTVNHSKGIVLFSHKLFIQVLTKRHAVMKSFLLNMEKGINR